MDKKNDFDKCINENDNYLCCVNEVGDMIKRIVRNFHLVERDQIKPLGFTMTQAYCLIEILKSSSITMQDLSIKMNLNTSTMTRIVDKLVRDKYIERFRSDEDRRIVLVRLTPEGIEAANKVQEKITSYYEDITRNLPKASIDNVLESVSLLMDAFEKSNQNCC